VTSDYFGALPGDPANGSTRVITQSHTLQSTYWVGRQANGGSFSAYWDTPGAVGHYDYGGLTMARTLGSEANQVAVHGRRVLIGWIGLLPAHPASQSLARDLSLSSGYELLQQFVPELRSLRRAHTHSTTLDVIAPASMQLEVYATFDVPGGPLSDVPLFGVDVLAASDGSSAVALSVDCSAPATDADCHVHVDATGQGGSVHTAPLLFGGGAAGRGVVAMHAIVDHSIIELIVNNRTAIVAYASPPSEHHSGVRLFGAGVHAAVDYWVLDSI
jgi:sucrose-6-phosphate hydrolase SacC (GH32 family)